MRGDVHEAFQVYAELKAGGWIPDCTVAGALANVCSSKMKSSNWNDRRGNLVLLERASGLLRDLNEFKVNPDTALWNVMVTCAGRAGQVHRAFNILQEMQERHCRADSVTYSSLIDACVKGGRRDLAMDVYGLAIKEVRIEFEFKVKGMDLVEASEHYVVHGGARRMYVWFGSCGFGEGVRDLSRSSTFGTAFRRSFLFDYDSRCRESRDASIGSFHRNRHAGPR